MEADYDAAGGRPPSDIELGLPILRIMQRIRMKKITAMMARPAIPPTTPPAMAPTLVEGAGVGVTAPDVDIVLVLMTVAMIVEVTNKLPPVSASVVVSMLASVVIVGMLPSVVPMLAGVVVATLVAGELTLAQ